MSKSKRLESIEKAVAERVAELNSELDTDPAEPERRDKRRALQAAEERARRVKQAQQKLAALAQEKAERAHGIIKTRGMTRFLVHGREKVRSVCLLQALALNLSWADTLRRRIAAAAAMAIPANA